MFTSRSFCTTDPRRARANTACALAVPEHVLGSPRKEPDVGWAVRRVVSVFCFYESFEDSAQSCS